MVRHIAQAGVGLNTREKIVIFGIVVEHVPPERGPCRARWRGGRPPSGHGRYLKVVAGHAHGAGRAGHCDERRQLPRAEIASATARWRASLADFTFLAAARG